MHGGGAALARSGWVGVSVIYGKILGGGGGGGGGGGSGPAQDRGAII